MEYCCEAFKELVEWDCHDCGIPDEATRYCPYCGSSLTLTSPSNSKPEQTS
jgi:rRNA maturation endonuclease Nob1